MPDEFPRCRCGKSVRFQAVTATLDEGFCSDECLDRAMGRGAGASPSAARSCTPAQLTSAVAATVVGGFVALKFL